MFIALRRFTLVCTIVLERLLLKKQHEKSTLGAVAVMIGGVFFLGITDTYCKGGAKTESICIARLTQTDMAHSDSMCSQQIAGRPCHCSTADTVEWHLKDLHCTCSVKAAAATQVPCT